MNRTRIPFLLAALLVVSATNGFAARTKVKMTTNYGDIIIELYNADAPNTVENFLTYVNDDFYDGLIFHRCIDGFMIQGGAYLPELYDADFSDADFSLTDPDFYKTPNDPINLEVTKRLKNLRGRVAMARTSSVNSATSQFFINVVDNTTLDPTSSSTGYAVFGEVVEGMDVVDAISLEPIIEDDEDVTEYFEALPVSPVIIEKVTIIQDFQDDSSTDFSDVPFLKATTGAIRSFTGQADYAESSFQHQFTNEDYLGIKCLKWVQTASTSDEMSSFTMHLAKDTDGKLWILKYVLNEDQTDMRTIIEAEILEDAVPFETYASQDMYFRLMTETYNTDNLSDPVNTVSSGSGTNLITEQIVSTTISLAPAYTDNNLVLVKWTRGPFSSPSETRWRYYHPELGLVLDLWNAAQNTSGNGWLLAPMNFDDTSTDFSEVPFIGVKTDTTRTYVGQGQYEGNTYTQTFTVSTATLLGLNYLTFQQSWEAASVVPDDLDSFTILLAKDVDGNIWVLKYVLNDQAVFEAESLLEVKLLSEFDDVMLFRLITGNYNADSLGDSKNTFTVGSRTSKIVSFTDTLSYVPHYQNELFRVKTWDGAVENANNISYYHDSIGLVLNLRNGETGTDADGFRLAFYGGTFDSDTSDDLSDVPFLNAVDGDTRTFLAQGTYVDPNDANNFNQTFSSLTYQEIACLRWKQTTPTTGDIQGFWAYLAKDSLGTIWVFRYYVNNIKIYSSESAYEAKLLSDFADENIHFRLIAGLYNPEDLDDPTNTITYTNTDDETVIEQIVAFNRELSDLPFLENDVIVVHRTVGNQTTPQELYFDNKTGMLLVLDIPISTSILNADSPLPNSIFTGNGWHVGWYGESEPAFDSASNDFSEVDFFKAQSGTVRVYNGQGNFEDSSYRQYFTTESFLGTNCLVMNETAVPAHNKNSFSLWLAKDANSKLWLLKSKVNGLTTFEASSLDFIAPFSMVPDMLMLLADGSLGVDDFVTSGSGDARETETIVKTGQTLSSSYAYKSSLYLTRWTLGQSPYSDLNWRYYHASAGLTLDLWENFYSDDAPENNLDPNYLDPNSADGWALAEAEDIDTLTAAFKASSNRIDPKDSFTLQGDWDITSDQFLTNTLYIQVGIWQCTLQADSFQKHKSKNQYTFQGSSDGTNNIQMVIDFDNKSFELEVRKINLTGMAAPVTVTFQTGTYFGSGTATLTKNIPLDYIMHLSDAIDIRKWRYVSDTIYNNNWAYVWGDISTQDYPLDLTTLKGTIKWGSTSTTVDIGKFVKTSSKNERYVFRSSSETLRYARFDLDKGAYKLYFKKTSLSAPTQTLTITFTDSNSNTVFSQTASVE